MKKLLSIFILCMLYNTVYAGSLQKKTKGFFDRSVTINNSNGGGKEDVGVTDNSGKKESVWNMDIYGMEVIFPQQPGYKQIVPSANAFGVTYKFSEHAQFWTRYSRFTLKGVKLDGVDTKWEHEHFSGGYGLRFGIAGDVPKQLVVNFGVSRSKVNELAQYGSIPNLEMGIVADVRYLWLVDNSSYGINLTIVEVESSSNSWNSYHKGGYMSIGLFASFAAPDLSDLKF